MSKIVKKGCQVVVGLHLVLVTLHERYVISIVQEIIELVTLYTIFTIVYHSKRNGPFLKGPTTL